MNRRAVLTGAAGLCVSLAGCAADDGDATETQSTTTEATTTTMPTPSEPVLVDRSLAAEPADDCPSEGDATIHAATDGVVAIDGCLWGRNGCSVVRLASADYDGDSDTARVTVQTVEEEPDDGACTQALVSLGYRVELEFDYQLPGRVAVAHDDVDGRRVVARREL
ncbi:hypothetical protein [Haloferax sp. YSSS75]|uniref:hypothetical protein n=1 Tax=Haloferax sp. YSSS75 TaxID=3388564 RepID=UPI00398D2D46